MRDEKPLKDAKAESKQSEGAGSSNRPSASQSMATISAMLSGSKSVERPKTEPSTSTTGAGPSQSQKTTKTSLLKHIVQEEIVAQRRDSLGLNSSRKLGSQPHSLKSEQESDDSVSRRAEERQASPLHATEEMGWACQVCTL